MADTTRVLNCLDIDELLHRHDHTCYVDGEPAHAAHAARTTRPTRTAHPAPKQKPAPTQAPVIPAARVERCDLYDLPVDICAHCKGHRSIDDELQEDRAARAQIRYAWTPAKQPGTCGNCRYPYGPGTPIQRHPDRGWVTQCCSDAP